VQLGADCRLNHTWASEAEHFQLISEFVEVEAGNGADALARDSLPAVHAIRNAGTTTLQGISGALNKQGMRTPRGKRWHVSSSQICSLARSCSQRILDNRLL
jgi:hypothetical protein